MSGYTWASWLSAFADANLSDYIDAFLRVARWVIIAVPVAAAVLAAIVGRSK